MAGIDFYVIGADKLAGLGVGFGSAGSDKVKRAVAIAINETLDHSKSTATKLITGIYAIKSKDFKAFVRIRRATMKNLSGRLGFAGSDSIPLSRFSHSVARRWISVTVLQKQKQRITSPGSKNILATKKRKLPAAFKARGQLWARTAESEKPVILYGPSLMAFFKKPENVEILTTDGEAFFEKELAHALANKDVIAANAARKAARGKKGKK